MLDAFVIEEIRRREHERTRDDRPAAELPLPPPSPPADPRSPGGGDDSSDRGVVIIDYG